VTYTLSVTVTKYSMPISWGDWEGDKTKIYCKGTISLTKCNGGTT